MLFKALEHLLLKNFKQIIYLRIMISKVISNRSLRILNRVTWKNVNHLLIFWYTFIFFQEGQYVVEKDFEGVGLTPYSPYHNSSFVYSGKSQHINAIYIFSLQLLNWKKLKRYTIRYNSYNISNILVELHYLVLILACYEEQNFYTTSFGENGMEILRIMFYSEK